MSDSLWPLGLYIAHQAPLSMEFSRQEYWSGLPCPFPRDLPNPGIKSGSLTLQADALPSEPPGQPDMMLRCRQVSVESGCLGAWGTGRKKLSQRRGFVFKYLFIWLRRVLAATHRIFYFHCCMWNLWFQLVTSYLQNGKSWLQHEGSSSPTRDQTWAPCFGSAVLVTEPSGKLRVLCL